VLCAYSYVYEPLCVLTTVTVTNICDNTYIHLKSLTLNVLDTISTSTRPTTGGTYTKTHTTNSRHDDTTPRVGLILITRKRLTQHTHPPHIDKDVLHKWFLPPKSACPEKEGGEQKEHTRHTGGTAPSKPPKTRTKTNSPCVTPDLRLDLRLPALWLRCLLSCE